LETSSSDIFRCLVSGAGGVSPTFFTGGCFAVDVLCLKGSTAGVAGGFSALEPSAIAILLDTEVGGPT
jgi:hypothetical protein